MRYTNEQFGLELLSQLDQGYDPMRIAKWAYAIFIEPGRRDHSRQVDDALVDIFTMEEGEKFYIPEKELRARAVRFAASGAMQMRYTDKQFGMELLTQLDQGYDPIRIARWAYTMFLDPDRRNRSRQVNDAMVDIFTMEEGEEFHIPEEELRATAERFASST